MDLRDFDRSPPVAIAMTPFPHAVTGGEPVETVATLMKRHGVRHVPVKEGARVIGIISESDLRAADNPALGFSRDALCARDVLSPEPYVVDLHTPLSVVLRRMAEEKRSSALILKGGRLAGIVSVTDVCRVLADILEARFGGGDEAA